MNSETEVINWEQFDSITDNGAPDFMDIYQDFLQATPELFESLKVAISRSDAKATAAFAHQLKGSAANFGFVGVSERVSEIEDAAHGGGFENVSVLFDQAWSAFQLGSEAVGVKYSV